MGISLGSLFDGSGGFPLAGCMCGMEPLWASEIEPYPIAVTNARFPRMKHLGDVQKISGAEIDPVDVITFGSPCQDMSIAGKRAGLRHEGNGDDHTTRSGLFIEAIRIIREMRQATNGKYPAFAVWENVPGAFSSNGGQTSKRYLKNSRPSHRESMYLFLSLKSADGLTPERSWETVSVSRGACSTRNTGECPSAARESTLSQILKADAPEKYYLSAKAAAGILYRAKKRGKELPTMLREALEEVIALNA